MATITTVQDPNQLYTTYTSEFINQMENFTDAMLEQKATSAKLSVKVNDAVCSIFLKELQYTKLLSTYRIDNPPVQISTQEYSLLAYVDNIARKVILKDEKTKDILWECTFESLDHLNTHERIREHLNVVQQPFIRQIIVAYQTMRHFPSELNSEETLLSVLHRTVESYHANNTVQKDIPALETNKDITSILDYINTLDELDSTLTGKAELIIQSEVNGTTVQTTVGKTVEVSLIDPLDANIKYQIQYNKDDSTILTVYRNQALKYQIPEFIFDNTTFAQADELEALRDTFHLYDAIYAGYKVLKHFQYKGTQRLTDSTDIIKQAYYSSLL